MLSFKIEAFLGLILKREYHYELEVQIYFNEKREALLTNLKHYTVWLFDLDGTLISSDVAIIESCLATLNKYGCREVSENEIRSMIGTPVGSIFSTYLAPDQVFEAKTYYSNYLISITTEFSFLVKDIIETLEYLKSINACIKVVTNKESWLATEILTLLGCISYFEQVIGCDKGAAKPSRQLIDLALGECKKHFAIMVGDSFQDIKAAQNAGIDSILIAKEKPLFDEFDAFGSTLVLNSISDLLEQLMKPERSKLD